MAFVTLEDVYGSIECLAFPAIYETYGDVRTLGDLWIIPSEGKTGISGYDTLGPDAIGDAFTPDYLYRKLKGTSRSVKAVILDQTVVAGVTLR